MIKFQTEPEFFQNFYKSLCGRVTSKTINHHIISLWPTIKNMNVLIIGWGFPYIHHFQNNNNFIACANPHLNSKTISKTPNKYKKTIVPININEFPFPNNFFDRILVVHGAEYSTDIIKLLNETEQLLKSNGRIITIMPNKSGLWRANEKTPFKHGAAITAGQLQWSLKNVGFEIDYYSAALSFPPTQSKTFLSLFTKWEGIGRNIFPFLSGVHIFEGHKNLYSGTAIKVKPMGFALNPTPLKVVPK